MEEPRGHDQDRSRSRDGVGRRFRLGGVPRWVGAVDVADPNTAIISAMSEQELAACLAALYGTADPSEPYDWRTGGCDRRWSALGRSHGRHRAVLVTVTGQKPMALDT